jgi:hypothetical protein
MDLPREDSAICAHARTRLVARDSEAVYIECLDCGEIIEAGESAQQAGFNESLSDA